MQHHRRRNIEITRTIYHKHFMQSQPNYDFYPSLSRRMSNGYEHRPTPIARPATDSFNFAMAASPQYSGVNATPQPVDAAVDEQATLPFSRSANESPHQDWDCYPMVLRNVQNYGSQDMRDRLYAMEHSLAHTL
ncbi:hypothetical protein INT44_006869 [Umbelopsis vinacea]|uniref:Uncharacterized protein n=1 Tax=Umbelopsis vinacea TaxID=44442 RepID=A0A8H7U9F5_9FUNG|nr:hypothetical protein INT44_006869 [Umbelopsis vinacea]